MNRILKISAAGGFFYRAGLLYHNTIDQQRSFKHLNLPGVQKIGTIFVFDTDAGFDNVLSQFDNVERVDMGKSYAPEYKKPALRVLTQAEFKRLKKWDKESGGK